MGWGGVVLVGFVRADSVAAGNFRSQHSRGGHVSLPTVVGGTRQLPLLASFGEKELLSVKNHGFVWYFRFYFSFVPTLLIH